MSSTSASAYCSIHLDEIPDDELYNLDLYVKGSDSASHIFIDPHDKLSDKELIPIVAKEFRMVMKRLMLYEKVYRIHGCDSFEHVFRDDMIPKLSELAKGLQYTLRELHENVCYEMKSSPGSNDETNSEEE